MAPALYPPSDESPTMIALDKATFMAEVFEGVLWGAHCVLFCLCLYHLRCAQSWKHHRKYTVAMIVFVSLLFILGTLNFAGDTAMNTLLFVENRFPGGPSGDAAAAFFYSNPVSIMTEATFFFGTFLTDGLLLYRTWMVWGGKRWVIVLPAMIWIAAFIMSMLLLAQLALPNADLGIGLVPTFQLAYLSLTAALNILLTLMIAGRLLSLSGRAKANLGSEHAKTYTSIATMVVESALPYSATLLAFIVSTAVNNIAAQNVLISLMAQMMCISPMLIIWRVAAGRAWSQKMVNTVTGGTSRRPVHSNNDAINMSKIRFNNDTTMQGSITSFSKTVD